MNEGKLALKIKKLLEIADPERGATEQERATALRQAHKMMRKASLDIADLDDAAYAGELGEIAKFAYYRPEPHWTNWPCTLWGACMRLNYLFAIYGDYELIAFGRRGQYEPAKALYETMLPNIVLAIRSRWPGTYDLENHSVRHFYDSFGIGATEAIYGRVLEMVDTEKQTASGTAALVVTRGQADYDKAHVQATREYLLGSNPHGRPKEDAAFNAGAEFGTSVDIDSGSSARTQAPKRIN